MLTREYGMIYRGPGFSRPSYDLAPRPTPSPLSLFLGIPVCRRSSSPTGGGGVGGQNRTTSRKPGPL